LVSSLPTEAVEWKRSYGRTSKSVYVEAEFHPIDVEALLKVSFNIEMHKLYSNHKKPEKNLLYFFLIYWLFNIKAKRSLNGQQVLHTFWTDCSDIETYKVNNKHLQGVYLYSTMWTQWRICYAVRASGGLGVSF